MKSLFDSLIGDQQSPDETQREAEALVLLTGVEFCVAVVNSREYRESIIERIKLGELAPAVECRLLDMAWGKAPTRIEHTGRDGQPIETITEVRRVIVHVAEQQQEVAINSPIIH